MIAQVQRQVTKTVFCNLLGSEVDSQLQLCFNCIVLFSGHEGVQSALRLELLFAVYSQSPSIIGRDMTV